MKSIETRNKDLAGRISRWMAWQVKSARAKGLVIGLSGGLDSAVVAVLARQALGKNTLALLLPCHSPGRADLPDARLVAKKFRIKTGYIDLSSLFNAFKRILPPAGKVTLANLKPRLRMIALYYFANKLNYLVAGTSNKSELTLGYYTKYGDGGVDILPLGSLLKKQVRGLACTLGIPERIINKSPSAGLWPGQTDEGELGITYTQLDRILANRYKPGRLKNVPATRLGRIKRRIKDSAHKRQVPTVFNISH